MKHEATLADVVGEAHEVAAEVHHLREELVPLLKDIHLRLSEISDGIGQMIDLMQQKE